MKGNDAVLALLQDIKDLLYGIGLLIFAGFICLIGALTLNSGFGLLILLVGIMILIYGILLLRRGYHHHEVLEQRDTTEE